ncbi:MAG TPA: cytochrome c [Chitinophagaceae bacterium]
MRTKQWIISLLTGLCLSGIANANPIEEGKTLFMTRCAACHNVNKVMTGPALAGVHERRTEEWIIEFVRSSQTLVKSGDKDAVALFEKFNKVPMPDHPDLTSENIKSIIEYIKTETKPVESDAAPFAKPGKKRVDYKPLSIQQDYWFFIGYLIVVGLLISSLLFAVRMKYFQHKVLDEKHPAE